MACAIRIKSVVADPATGDIHITGELEGCPSSEIGLSVTCGSNSYTALADVLPGQNSWSGTVPGPGCACGEPITVVAVCTADASCAASLTTSTLCCCPVVTTSLIYGSCTGSSQLVTFDTSVSISTPGCAFTFRRNFGDGIFGAQNTLTGTTYVNLPLEQHSYATPNTYTSTVDVLSPPGCGVVDSATVVAQCDSCHTNNLVAALCQLLETIFLVSISVGLVLTAVTPCTTPLVTSLVFGTAIVALALFYLLGCDKCICGNWLKWIGQILLVAGILFFMFILPSCSLLSGLPAFVIALLLIAAGFSYLSDWYNHNKSTCPLIICDLWCAVAGLMNTRSCTNLAALGGLAIVALTAGVLWAGYGVLIFVIALIVLVARGVLANPPCNNSTPACH